jgi:hypothetical protein
MVESLELQMDEPMVSMTVSQWVVTLAACSDN